MPLTTRPAPAEFDPYYGTYVNAVPDGDVLEVLARGGEETFALLSALPEEMGSHRYAPGKWTIRDVAQHLADSERVFCYRALRFARGDTTPLPGFDQNPYADAAKADRRPLTAIATELRALRQATLSLVQSLDDEMLARSGVASGCPVSVRALVWIIAGHERHHMRVLRERYLAGSDGGKRNHAT
ncbi:MAG TPA: DinB family protein [Gemmatimonadales bacterium]